MSSTIPVDSLPPYSPASKELILQATTPSQNRRYSKSPNPDPNLNGQALISHIPAKTRTKDLFNERSTLGEGWEVCQHPEGDYYFFHQPMHLVTSSDIRKDAVIQVLSDALSQLTPQLGLGDLSPIEIYLNIADHAPSSTPIVEYYLIDHNLKQVFWLHGVSPASVGLPDFPSFGYLKSMLTPEYWTHIDYFPMHTPLEFIAPAEEELMQVLAHGKLDAMTSPGSTCPYSGQECSQYLDTLDRNRRLTKFTGYRTSCIARLWNAMARARHINNYGLENPRLDRLQGFHEFRLSAHKPSVKLSFSEALTFFISVPIWERLMDLFNGRVVYQRHWAVFFADMRSNWLIMGSLAVGTLACDVCLLANGAAGMVTAASASLASAAVFSAVYLHQLHPEYQLGTGPEISAYVMKYEDYHHGLRPLSIALALPQALTIYGVVFLIWGIAMSTVQKAQNMQEAAGMLVALSLGALPVLIVSSFFSPSTSQGPSFWSRIFSQSSGNNSTKSQT